MGQTKLKKITFSSSPAIAVTYRVKPKPAIKYPLLVHKLTIGPYTMEAGVIYDICDLANFMNGCYGVEIFKVEHVKNKGRFIYYTGFSALFGSINDKIEIQFKRS